MFPSRRYPFTSAFQSNDLNEEWEHHVCVTIGGKFNWNGAVHVHQHRSGTLCTGS